MQTRRSTLSIAAWTRKGASGLSCSTATTRTGRVLRLRCISEETMNSLVPQPNCNSKLDLTRCNSICDLCYQEVFCFFRRRFRFSFRFRAQEAQAEGCGQESSRRLRVVPANMTTCHPYAHLGKRVAARLEGRSAGTCHKCGASLNSPFPRARYCERCGTLYHTYDCGKRLSSLHISTAPVECPKVCPSHSKGGVTT